MIEIKEELTAHLEAAKARYKAARQQCEDATAEVTLIGGLIEKFDELAKDATRALRAVLPAPVQNDDWTHRRLDHAGPVPLGVGAWPSLIGKRVTVTYRNGDLLTGQLTGVDETRLTLDQVDGYAEDGMFNPHVVSVESVVPVESARRTLNPENLVAAACKHCGQQLSRNTPANPWHHPDDSYYCCGGEKTAEPELDPTSYAAPLACTCDPSKNGAAFMCPVHGSAANQPAPNAVPAPLVDPRPTGAHLLPSPAVTVTDARPDDPKDGA